MQIYTVDGLLHVSMQKFINAQDSLDNPIGQNEITWGVLTDCKDMAYQNQNQSSAYVPAIHQLFYLASAHLNQSE